MDSLGRFGHHPDPAIDFCCEVDAIDGLVYDASVGLADRQAVSDRIFNAMMFRVGGDANAISAKDTLRDLEKRINS